MQSLQQTPGLRQESHGIVECFGLGRTSKLISTPCHGQGHPDQVSLVSPAAPKTTPVPGPNTNMVTWYQSILILQFKPRKSQLGLSAVVCACPKTDAVFGVPVTPAREPPAHPHHNHHQLHVSTTRASPLGLLIHRGKNK